MQRTVMKREWLSLGAVETDARAGVSPAAFGAFMCLLVASPLMRGGNRHVALVLLEAAAIAFIAMLFTSGAKYPERWHRTQRWCRCCRAPCWSRRLSPAAG